MLPCVIIGTAYLIHSFGMEYRGGIGQGSRPYDVHLHRQKHLHFTQLCGITTLYVTGTRSFFTFQSLEFGS